MIKLLNALPNIALPDAGDALIIKGIDQEQAKKLLAQGFESFIGHQSFADVLSLRLGIDIPLNRSQATCEGTWLVAYVQPPRRLAEGEIWTEQEILNMPIKYCVIDFPSEDDKKMFRAFNNPRTIDYIQRIPSIPKFLSNTIESNTIESATYKCHINVIINSDAFYASLFISAVNFKEINKAISDHFLNLGCSLSGGEHNISVMNFKHIDVVKELKIATEMYSPIVEVKFNQPREKNIGLY